MAIKNPKLTKEEMKSTLANNIVSVTFTKTDGSTRVLKGTLLKEQLPKNDDYVVSKREQNPEILAVYDLEAKDWRSFRISSVKKFKILENT